MISSIPDAVRRRMSWSIFVLACLAYLGLGIAEQGVRGSNIQAPPPAPLPFDRHRVFGLDLTEYSSLEALEWLTSAGSEPLALVAIPIDADVVTALGQPDRQENALTAMDALIDAAGGSPLIACLRKPTGTVSGLGVAQSAVGTLTERYPNRISYVTACDHAEDRDWLRDIGEATISGQDTAPASAVLYPLSAGAPLGVVVLDDDDKLDPDRLATLATGSYTLLQLEITEPVGPLLIARAQTVLAETATAALVLTRPVRELDPSTVVDSLQGILLDTETMPEGFSSVASPDLGIVGDWQPAAVGTVPYLRTTASDTLLTIDFVGTEAYLIALRSPQAGQINVWVDPVATGDPPTATIDLHSVQAYDDAIVLATDLPAARHNIVIQTANDNGEGSSVVVSGVFVAGKPTTSWTGMLAAVGIAVMAMLALAERCFASVMSVRSRTVAPPEPEVGHPRVFTRR